MDLDLRKLRYFVAVAELLHFRRAAERLHVAQPALSRQIRSLESELGAELFQRDTRSVSLTPAGRQLFEDASGLLAAAQAARRRALRAARGRDLVVVGFMPGVVVTPALRAFAALHPGVAFEAVRVGWGEQAAVLLDGRVDLGFLRRPFDAGGLRVLPLHAEPCWAVLPREHPLARRRALRLSDLSDTPLIHHKTHNVHSVEDKLELVASGGGAALLPEGVARYYRRPDVKCVPVSDAAPNEVCVAYAAGRRSALLAELSAVAQTVPYPGGGRRRARPRSALPPARASAPGARGPLGGEAWA